MKISQLTYEMVGADLSAPTICQSCELSQNFHHRGGLADHRLHWSRTGMRRSSLHAFVRARLDNLDWPDDEAVEMLSLWSASTSADRIILSKYGIRIPASASRWERRRVLAIAKRNGIKLRTDNPQIYAWATYKGESI
jgi:hypothetical protein